MNLPLLVYLQKKARKDSGGPCAFSRMHTSEKVKGIHARFVCVVLMSGGVRMWCVHVHVCVCALMYVCVHLCL